MNQQNRWLSLALTLLLSLVFILVAAANHLPAQAAGNTLTLDTVTAAAGASGTFAITLDNSDAVASGQVRFTYATSLGFTITGVQVTGRTAGFTSTGSTYATGNATLAGYQVLFYNLNNLTITPGAGAILTLSYTLAANASGSTPLQFTQAILASAAAQALPVTPVDGSLTIQAATATPTATAAATATSTELPSTATATATPTATAPELPPTATATATATSTEIPAAATPTPTVTATATNAEPPPTATLPAIATSIPDGSSNTPTPNAPLPEQIYLPLVQR